MNAYYNEIDPAAVAILRQLISDDVIAQGDVDTRSIKDVRHHDLRGYDQCHFFAGGGLWSVAARMAGWPDGRPLWTGSCPCQPFSPAGKGGGTDDPRHLWPDFHRLIRAVRPAVVMGEQVAGAAGYGWFDGVRADLEGEDYASRGVDIPACAVDAPHKRNRLYWIAAADDEVSRGGARLRENGPEQHRVVAPNGHGRVGEMVNASRLGRGEGLAEPELWSGRATAAGADASGVTLGDAFRSGLEGFAGHGDGIRRPEQDRPVAPANVAGAASQLADADKGGRGWWAFEQERGQVRRNAAQGHDERNSSAWAAAEWITCHDGKARRTKPGLRLLVDGLPGRVDLWRVGGNAIVPVEAAEVIAAFMES